MQGKSPGKDPFWEYWLTGWGTSCQQRNRISPLMLEMYNVHKHLDYSMNQELSSDARLWLLDHLAQLVKLGGHEQFTVRPIVEPNNKFFPDPWNGDGKSVWRITRRLMDYAGLTDHDALVEIVSESDGLHTGVPAWYKGMEKRVFRFGVKIDEFHDAEQFVAAMAHEVAHAYRDYHRIQIDTDIDEERLTDLTSVYLGFGVMATNAAYKYRTSGGTTGAYSTLTWSHLSLGYLPPEVFANLLAIQCVVRGWDEDEARQFRRLLEPTQSRWFRDSFETESENGDSLRAILGIPHPDSWPDEPELEAILIPITGRPRVIERQIAISVPPIAGGVVFRVRKTRAAYYTVLGLFAGVVVGEILGSLDAGVKITFTGMFLATGIGFVAGRRSAYDTCSDPACKETIPDQAAQCPGCHRKIAGRIKDENDRLDAEEALAERSRKQKKRKPKKR